MKIDSIRFGLAVGLALTMGAANVQAAQKAAPAASARSGPEKTDPSEREYEKLLEVDDAAQEEVDRWIKEAKEFEAKGATLPKSTLNGRIEKRFNEVRRAYEQFLTKHPKHARARLAYGSFLYEIHDEERGVEQWERARELDPKNPAAWNNLANHYGHRGPVKKAFEYYGRAIKIDRNEPVYLQNLATTVYLFRQDAQEFFNLTELEVFNKALGLYRQAIQLDPKNFTLATDLAQSYYGIKPMRVSEALAAWEYALKVANDDIERQGVYLHMARVELNSGRFGAARQHLGQVSLPMYEVLKARLTRNLGVKEAGAKSDPASATSTEPAQDDVSQPKLSPRSDKVPAAAP